MRLFAMAALAAFVTLTSGCATITKGTTQVVTVNTDPPGAQCTLTRDSKALALVNATPGAVAISKSSGAIAVVCKKDKFLDAAGTLSSEFQAMTFGNVLFGGLIGVVVDAASGASHEYPPIVTITLIPAEFASIADRDSFYERMRQNLLREAADVKERIAEQCAKRTNEATPGSTGKGQATGTTAPCDQELVAADAGTRAKLAEIDQKQALSKISGP